MSDSMDTESGCGMAIGCIVIVFVCVLVLAALIWSFGGGGNSMIVH